MNLLILLINTRLVVCLLSSSTLWSSSRSLFENFVPMNIYKPSEFPKWLHDMTGLTDWPGIDPPYIPLDYIDFTKVPNIPKHSQTQCAIVRHQCSFDCYHCVADDEIYTCPTLTQTFDDGPSIFTLNLINKLQQQVTFFTLGLNVIKFPEIYRLCMAKGHIMGSHTWSHKYLPGLTNEQIVAQIQWSIWAMNATGNHTPKWFRPPYGGLDNRVRAIIRQFGMQSVLWNFDTFDWKLLLDDDNVEKHEQQIYTDLTKFKISNNNRGIILQHDHSQKTVDVAIKIDQLILNHQQKSIPQCVNGVDYIRKYL